MLSIKYYLITVNVLLELDNCALTDVVEQARNFIMGEGYINLWQFRGGSPLSFVKLIVIIACITPNQFH